MRVEPTVSFFAKVAKPARMRKQTHKPSVYTLYMYIYMYVCMSVCMYVEM